MSLCAFLLGTCFFVDQANLSALDFYNYVFPRRAPMVNSAFGVLARWARGFQVRIFFLCFVAMFQLGLVRASFLYGFQVHFRHLCHSECCALVCTMIAPCSYWLHCISASFEVICDVLMVSSAFRLRFHLSCRVLSSFSAGFPRLLGLVALSAANLHQHAPFHALVLAW